MSAPKSVWVYFVRATTLRLIKIGRARDMGQRLSGLQVGSPDKLELMGIIRPADPEQLEADLHRRFDRHRTHGEWFSPAPALEAYIAEHAISLEADRQEFIWEMYERMGVDTSAARALQLEAWEETGELPPIAVGRTPREIITASHPLRPQLPAGIIIKGNGPKARLARYKAARGITD